MANKLQVFDAKGIPRGIDQSDKPGPNTMRDMCNVDLSTGSYTMRPGTFPHMTDFAPNVTHGVFEYKKDTRYASSFFDCLVVWGTAVGSYSKLGIIKKGGASSSTTTPTISLGTYTGGVTIDLAHPVASQAQAVQGLWKRTVTGHWTDGKYIADSYEYVPALLIVSEGNYPFVYFQDTSSRDGAVFYLDAIDGGLSDMTCLKEPPKAKIVKIFKERTFFMNCSDASNRIYFTGNDAAGAFPMNVFPSEYNLDIGHAGLAIVDAVPTQDRMYIFTTDGTYILYGDGSEGIWSISKINNIPAAINTNAVLSNDGVIYFVSPSGVYSVKDTSFQNISHPRVAKLWDALYPTAGMISGNDLSASLRGINLIYNKTDNILMVNFRNKNGSSLIYYDQMDAWSRWGNWDTGTTQRAPDAVAYDLYFYSQQYLFTNFFSKQGSVVLLLGAVGLVEFRKTECTDGTLYPIHWFIETNDYLSDDDTLKTLRYLEIEAGATGEWYMSIVPMHDGQHKEDAIRDKAGTKWNIINDDASSAVHAIGSSDASSNFTAASDGPVDVVLLDTMYKMSTNQSIKRPVSGLLYTIEFNSSQDYSLSGHTSAAYVPGRLMVMQAGVANRYDLSMLMGDTSAKTLNGTNKFKLGVDQIHDHPPEIKTVPMNVTGRRFSFWMSNCGTVHPLAGRWAQEGMPLNLIGWSLWYIPKGRLRPNG